MVIQINIKALGEDVSDELDMEDTTLLENAVALRRLEEIKQKLLEVKYKSDYEVRR